MFSGSRTAIDEGESNVEIWRPLGGREGRLSGGVGWNRSDGAGWGLEVCEVSVEEKMDGISGKVGAEVLEVGAGGGRRSVGGETKEVL